MLLFLGVILGTSPWFLWRAHSRIGDQLGQLARISDSLSLIAKGPEESFSHRLLDLEDAVDRLPKKWEEMVRASAAAEARARSHVKRAQKELEERGFTDAGLDQLGQELLSVDEDGSPVEGVQPLRESVDIGPESPDADKANEDWREMARMRKFGASA